MRAAKKPIPADVSRARGYIERYMVLHQKALSVAAEAAIAEAGLASELGLPPIKTYIIGGKGARLVKIGKSYDVNARVRALQSGSPVELEIMRVIPFDCERAMHVKYAHLRRHGEWFDLDLDMLTDLFSGPLVEQARAMEAA